MKKRLLAMFLVTSMVATCFVGCGKNGNTAEKESSVATKNTSESQTVEEDGNFNATGYPVVDEPITLTIMSPADTGRGLADNWEENPAWQELSEITGVKFEFITAPYGEYSEKLSLTLASEELPDIFLGGFSNSELADNIKVGNIIDLTPYIEAYGENINYYMENLEGFKEGITVSTGEIASLPWLNMMTESGKCPAAQIYFYKPWMDKLNLEVPTTVEEFYDVLVAFKTQDPNGNGIADEIPFMPRNLNNFYDVWGMFGVLVQKNKFAYADGDEIKFSPFMDEFKEGLKFMHKLHAEGLVNPDVITDGDKDTLAKGGGETDITGAVIGGAAFSIVGEARNDDMILAPYIAAEGREMVWQTRTVVNPGKFMITSACEHPEVALRVWDYMFSEDGAKLLWMGPEENYTYNEDGTWNWNLAEGQTVEELRANNTIQNSITCAAAFPQDWFYQNAGSETAVNADRVFVGTEYADNLRLICPALNFTSYVSEDLAIIEADLNSHVMTSIAQFVTGELDIDKDWDNFVKQCENLRVEEYIQMYQDAYDSYLGK